MLYALLDKSDHIRLEHLKAAAALWQYCEDSVKTIFGALLTPEQSKIFEFIADRSVNKTQIFRECFKNNREAKAIENDLKALLFHERIIKEDGNVSSYRQARKAIL